MSVIFGSIKKAWSLLLLKGSLVRLILAGILLCLAFVLPMMLGVYLPIIGLGVNYTPSLAEGLLEYLLVYGIALGVGLFVTLPASGIFFTYTWQVYSNARYGYVDRERKKGAYNYFRNLFSGAVIMARPLACFLLFQLSYEGAYALSEICVFDGIAIPMIIFLVPFFILSAVISVIFLWLTSVLFLVPYYHGRGMSIWRAIGLGARGYARSPFIWDLFFLVFALMSALSLISVGSLFVLLVLPLMMFTYFTIAEHMDGYKLLEDQK